MPTATKKESPLVLHEPTGEKYVRVDSIMHPMVAGFEGIPVTTFPGDDTWFVPLASAISFVEKEMQAHSREEYAVVLGVLNRFKHEV